MIPSGGDIPDKNSAILQTGGLRFYRPEIGAKPTAAGLKKKKPLDLSEIAPKILSELIRQAMQMIDMAEYNTPPVYMEHKNSAWMRNIGNDYLAAQNTEIRLPIMGDRLAALTAWIAAGSDQENLKIKGNWLYITGQKETYMLNLVTSRTIAIDPERECFISPMPDTPVPQGLVPHGHDHILLHHISIAEILLKDDKPENKNIHLRNQAARNLL